MKNGLIFTFSLLTVLTIGSVGLTGQISEKAAHQRIEFSADEVSHFEVVEDAQDPQKLSVVVVKPSNAQDRLETKTRTAQENPALPEE